MGETDKPIARGRTFDGKTVLVWADGLVTFGLGHAIAGVGSSRDQWSRRMDLRAALALICECELFDAAEMSASVRAVRKLFRGWNWAGRAPTPGYVRSIMHRATIKA